MRLIFTFWLAEMHEVQKGWCFGGVLYQKLSANGPHALWIGAGVYFPVHRLVSVSVSCDMQNVMVADGRWDRNVKSTLKYKRKWGWYDYFFYFF